MSRGPLLDRSLRSLLGGPTRGKCRHGDGHESCTLTLKGWYGEDGSGYECQLAPPVPCKTCDGAGEIEVQVRNADGTEDPRRKPCLPCRGHGKVAGPHFPWRREPPEGAAEW